MDRPTDQAAHEAARRRVLLAEDDESLRKLIASSLESDGFEVWQARDGEELLAEIETVLAHEPGGADSCVVVTDMHMPGLGGLDVLAVLRCASVSTPVILMTAFGDDEVFREARDLGSISVLSKPFALDTLREAVMAAIRPQPRP